MKALFLENIHLSAESLGYSELAYDANWMGNTEYLDNIPAEAEQGYFFDGMGRRAVIIKLNPTTGFVLFEREAEHVDHIVAAPLLNCPMPFAGMPSYEQATNAILTGHVLAGPSPLEPIALTEPMLAYELAYGITECDSNPDDGFTVRLSATPKATIYRVAEVVKDEIIGVEQVTVPGKDPVVHPITWVDGKIHRPNPFNPDKLSEFAPHLGDSLVFIFNRENSKRFEEAFIPKQADQL